MAEHTAITEFDSGEPVPERYCPQCENRMYPVRWSNGRLEGAAKFSKKKYCSPECVHKARRKPFVDGHGYRVVYGIREHRLVAERHLGRPLREEEAVHHINGDKTDNRWENLRVFSSHSDHMEAHEDDRRQWTAEGDAVLAWCRDHNISMTRISRLLGVSYHSVTNRAKTLTSKGRIGRVTPGRKPGGPPPIPAWLSSLADDMKRLDVVHTGNQDKAVRARHGP